MLSRKSFCHHDQRLDICFMIFQWANLVRIVFPQTFEYDFPIPTSFCQTADRLHGSFKSLGSSQTIRENIIADFGGLFAVSSIKADGFFEDMNKEQIWSFKPWDSIQQKDEMTRILKCQPKNMIQSFQNGLRVLFRGQHSLVKLLGILLLGVSHTQHLT